MIKLNCHLVDSSKIRANAFSKHVACEVYWWKDQLLVWEKSRKSREFLWTEFVGTLQWTPCTVEWGKTERRGKSERFIKKDCMISYSHNVFGNHVKFLMSVTTHQYYTSMSKYSGLRNAHLLLML